MYAICVESSHKRGMGHLFRSIVLAGFLSEQDVPFTILINRDETSCSILSSRQIPFVVVDNYDANNDWETGIIRELGISLWINDRLDTHRRHSSNVKKNHVGLVTFDDRGSGAELADIHFAPLAFIGQDRLQGKKVLTGKDFLILNKEIDAQKRLRQDMRKILVTLGGSDTYGVTIDVMRILKDLGISADIHIGPSFSHRTSLDTSPDSPFNLIDQPSSLIETFSDYDLAITGGGITPFEANASGLPCLTISSEQHEQEACAYLQYLGTSMYLGHRNTLSLRSFKDAFSVIDIREMSQAGMREIRTHGIKNIMDHLRRL